MTRLVLFALGALSPLIVSTSYAAELCSGWERKIEPDMQIQESDFTLKAFDKALDTLSALGREPRDESTWIAEGNALTFVKGWLLKKAAIESLGASANSKGNKDVEAFCRFLVNDAFYHD